MFLIASHGFRNRVPLSSSAEPRDKFTNWAMTALMTASPLSVRRSLFYRAADVVYVELFPSQPNVRAQF